MDKTYTDMIMMNRITVACVVLAGCVTMFSGCRKDKIEPPVPLDPDNIAVREDRKPFHKSDPMTGKTPSAKVSSDKLKLHFFGWARNRTSPSTLYSRRTRNMKGSSSPIL